MTETASFEVVVVVYRSRHVLPAFLAAVGKDTPVVLVDNSYGEEDLSGVLEAFPLVRHIDSGGNLGFSAAANLGVTKTSAEYVVFMNPDTVPSEASLRALVGYLELHPEVASVGAAGISSAGGGAQPTLLRVFAHSVGLHRLLPMSGVFFYPRRGEHVPAGWISGSCLAVRRAAFEAVGGFDTADFVYMSDFELGRRLHERGYRQMLLGDVVVPHADGGSSAVASTWTWDRRGRGWTRYLRRTKSTPAAVIACAVLVVGLAARFLVYLVGGRRNRAREMWTYLRSIVAEWVAPVTG